MNIPRNRQSVFKYALGTTLLALVASATLLWMLAGQLISPNRQAIQDYQLDWIKHPSAHGVKIQAYPCSNGRVPCIFVSPDPSLMPGRRGAIIRKQLAADGISLKPYGQTVGILLLLHGRNGRKEDLLPVAERFAAAGFKCVIPDLPAHGDSPVNQVFFSTTRFEQSIADDVLADARIFFADNNSPAGIWGLSMGGAYAINAVSRTPSHWKAMVIVSSFDSLEGVVQDKLPSILSAPVSRILAQMVNYRSGLELSHVQPAVWAKNISIPILMAHGNMDPLISSGRGKALFNAFDSQKKRWLEVPGGTHNNILVTDMPLYASMGEWFITYLQ